MKKIIYQSSLVLLLITACSCNKWLDLKPRDGITREAFWKTKEDVQAAVAGIYTSLLAPPPGVGDKALTEWIFIQGEIRADMVAAAAGITQDEVNAIDVNIVSSTSLSSWAAFYRTINYCNTVLDYSPGVKATDPTLTDAQLNAYSAEALTIRAMMYFYLVRTWRDVPLKLTSTAKDTDLENLPKSTAATILAQIVSDLKKAEAGAVNTYGNTASDKGRVTKNTVNALLADVYLWMDNYTDCIAACNKIINSQLYALQNGTGSWYTNVFYNGSSTETIFEFSNRNSVNNVFWSLLTQPRKRYMTNNYLSTDVFPADDVDPDRFFDIRAGEFFNSGNLAITKWGTENPSYVNWQAYRISDIMLLKAEALAMTGAGAEAIAIIDEIRLKRNAVTASAQTPDPGDGDAIVDYILAERSREFAFEGKRWYDLLRVAKRDNYRRLSVLLDMVSRTVSPLIQQSAITKYKDVNSHYMPIADSELFADPLLVQNPFYTK
ncbi:RagB/SusD family nutrient uptake outer membrane protein [Pedobacter frigiditerrae]|uniref:RagB/SusD family nutrient uptake outer membrane protein n=1 Tax=Pedobacter frigiditerrae TaxID=2530452 RepID=UPI00292EF489|nr:RagB/SusD family nutrient uptake outer membrane protein [Pedobacter frigiditerrae]